MLQPERIRRQQDKRMKRPQSTLLPERVSDVAQIETNLSLFLRKIEVLC